MRNFEATNAAIPVSLVFVPAVPVASKAIKAPVLDSAASSQGNDTAPSPEQAPKWDGNGSILDERPTAI
jgi:hypothetical protein